MNDARFKRMAKEYEALRSTQNTIMDGLEDVLPAMASAIDANSKGIQENREAIQENREAILVNTSMLQAIIEHLEVPYEEKPPMGFRQG
ncbi:MAG: hypothetical protein J4G18_08500 [Anaerolineae bacterium]|nr:hypothetical protein [Anaerolineae bacterium]